MANVLTKAMQWTGATARRGVKAFQMRWRGIGTNLYSRLFLPRTTYDYAGAVGDGSGSNIVVACTNWVARNFPEAPIRVVDEDDDGMMQVVPKHAMTRKLRRPNPYHSGLLLWTATLPDLLINGNAYWAIVKANGGDVAQLWWIPSWLIEPKWPQSGAEYISHYEYRVNPTTPIRVKPVELVHFRLGLDAYNTRKGPSGLASLVREVFTDDEAANMTAAVLKNLGVPGVFIAPEGGDVELQEEDADNIRDKWGEKFTGDERGKPFVMSGPTKVTRLSMTPEEMNLRDLRRIPEERVSAVLGIPAIVVGFGAGLDRSTFANMSEAREMAYENCIIPMQRLIAADLDIQLLPHFSDTESEQTEFDLSRVRVLQEDENKKATRWREMVAGGYAQRAEARAAFGLEVQDTDRVYIMSMTTLEVPAGQPAPALLPSGNGTEPEKSRDTLEAKARPLQVGRTARIDRAERLLARFLSAQGRRVAERLARFDESARGNGSTETKQTADDLLPASELRELERVLGGIHFASIEYANEAAAGMIGVAGLTEADPAFRRLLETSAQRITQVSEGTRQAVSTQLAIARERGYSVRQMTRGVPSDGYVGIADSHGFSRSRAEVIARTEIATVENITAINTWRNSGVVNEVTILDGDDCGWTEHNDPDKAHGSTRSLSDVEDYPTAHPNCVRTLVPVVRATVPA